MTILSDKPLEQRNASDPDVVAVQTETSVDICNDTPSYSLADTTDLEIPTDNDDIVALFQKPNYMVCISVGKHHFFLHPFVSTFDNGAVPNLVY